MYDAVEASVISRACRLNVLCRGGSKCPKQELIYFWISCQTMVVKYIFGNPGSTELPLNDALTRDSRLKYILGLQEVPVMAMADGYSMASGSLGVVNLHVCPGLGNAMGMLYNAFREGTPLLVTAGQQDRRLYFDEPILGGEMVEVTRPWTKWSVEVSRVEDLPAAVRRAAQIALTPPTGPVFMSLPVDVQMER